MKLTLIGPRTVFILHSAAALSVAACGSEQVGARERAEFDAFYEKITQTQADLFRGRPQEPFKALWSHASDVTLFGVLGGKGEHGWDQVGPRLDWAATQYADGILTTERIASYVEGNLGYVVQLETVRFKVPGQSEESLLQIRVTWIFRREREGWRIVHRHADPQTTRQGTAEGRK